MQHIQKLEFRENSQEELLPDFSPDYPYISTCAELDRYIEPVVPWHWHRAVELFYMESGTLEYTTPKGKWRFPAGTGGFVNANVLHTSRIVPSGENTVQYLHLFEPSLVAGETGCRMEWKYILPLTGSDLEVIPLDPEILEQAELLKKIRDAFDLDLSQWGGEFRLREALSELWLKLFALAGLPREQKTDPRLDDGKIKELMIYMHEHYPETITVEQLAELAHVSKRACFRLFRENLHMTPMEYLRDYRLQMASHMLIKTKEPVTQIGYACGLGSASYFGKIFRQHFGCSPMEFRRKWHDRDSNMQDSDILLK